MRHLLTNGITIGFSKYRVEESRTTVRPMPCYNCTQYHEETKCPNQPHCYKYGNCHPRYQCKVSPNKVYRATCRKQGLQTVASNYPFRPKQGKKMAQNKIFGLNEAEIVFADNFHKTECKLR